MPFDRRGRLPWRSLAVIAGGYLVFGLVWILVSDRLAEALAPSEAALSRWQTLKGAAFVLLSAGLVAALVWRESRRLRRATDYWRGVIDKAPVGFWMIDPEARTLWVNPSLAEMLDYSPQAMVGRTPFDFVDPASRPILEREINNIPYTRHRHYEVDLCTRGGGTVPAQFHATTLRDNAGALVGAFAFVSDLSAPRRRERDLRESYASLSRQQDFIEAVLDHLPGPFFAFDAHDRLVLWNRHFPDLQGFPDSQVLAMRPADFFTPESQQQVRAGAADAFRHGGGAAEGVVVATDGRRLPYRLHARRLEGYGEPLAVGLGVDVSREKAVEGSLERSNRALRTLSRANEALVHAEDEATLLQEVCAILVTDGGYHEAWIGSLQEPQGDQLTVRAARVAGCESAGERATIQVAWDDPEGAVFARVRQSGVPEVVAGSHQAVACVSQSAQAVQPRETMILPLGEQPVTGFLVVCSPAGEGFGDEEQALLQELAADLAFGLDALAARAERDRSLEELRQAAAVFRQTAEGIAITDTDERFVAVNEAFTRITGYTEAEVLGQTPRILSSGLHDREFYQSLWQSLKQTGVWQGEIWNRRKNGEVFPEWQTISEVRDEAGEVVNYVAVFSDITQARRTEEELSFLLYHDPLTGLPNRTQFRERLAHALQTLPRRSGPVAMVALDLEGFGTINDSLGQAVADGVLKQAARCLQGALRPGDTISRPGSDEFWVLLEDLGHGEDAGKMVQGLLAALRAPLAAEGRTLRLEAVAGVALAPADGDSVDGLVGNALTALHKAKETGAGPVQFFRRELGNTANRRLELEQALKQAIEQEELRVWYQPQVALASGRIVGLEALVRWQHPEWGLVSPEEFIPVAEASGLVVPMGEWVLGRAIEQFARWRDQGFALQRMGINVAAGQLVRTGLPDQLARHLAQSGLPAGAVELEITEEGFLTDLAESQATLQAITELGAHLAIDDFGTGYSSLAYLKRLPVDTLKVDKAFIDGLPGDEHDRTIVQAVLAVADQMGLEVVAEGVELERQAEWLRRHGVALAQGFLWSRPQPAEAMTEQLARLGGDGFGPSGGDGLG